MFSKFTVDLLKIAPKIRQISLYSTNKNSTPAAKPPRDWEMEPAKACDSDKILCFIEKHYLKEEPLAKALIPGKKPAILRKCYKEGLESGLTLVAKKCCGDKEIVGVCLNDRIFKCSGQKMFELSETVKDCDLRKLFETWALLETEPKMNCKLNEVEFFRIGTLSVDEKHWGKGIGLALCQKSLELAVEKNYNYVKINCTNDNTRKIAEKLNMTKFWCAPYTDLLCRGNIKPRAMPEPPHNTAHVYYLDLKTLQPKC
jgi:GNAT superfamily N-acetyltransferase